MRKKDIDKFIEELIIENGTSNPYELCKAYGVKVSYHSNSFKGLCIKLETEEIYISLRDDLDGLNKFFTLSHELFHALYDLKDAKVEYGSILKPFTRDTCVAEASANYFASRLLFSQDDSYIESLVEESPECDKKVLKHIEKYVYNY